MHSSKTVVYYWQINISNNNNISFSLCSFSNALVFKSITNEDIAFIQQYVRTELHEKIAIDQNFNPAHKVFLFGGFASNSDKFCFNRGEEKLIAALIAHVKKEVDDPVENAGLWKFHPPMNKKILSNMNHYLCSTTIGTIFGYSVNIKQPIVTKSLNELREELASKVKKIFDSLDTKRHVQFSEGLITVTECGPKISGTIQCVFCEEDSAKKSVKVFRHSSSTGAHWVLSNLTTHIKKYHSVAQLQNKKRQEQHETTIDLEITPILLDSVDEQKQETIEVDLVDQLYTQLWTQNMRLENAVSQEADNTYNFYTDGERSIEACRINGDGNCLFASLTHQLFYYKINSAEHQSATAELRIKTVQFIKDNFDSFENELKGRVLEVKNVLQKTENMRKECQFFLNTCLPKGKKCWGGIETIKAVSQIHKTNIIVVHDDGTCHLPVRYNSIYERCLLIAYSSVGDKIARNHYDSIANVHVSLVDEFSKTLINNEVQRCKFMDEAKEGMPTVCLNSTS